MPRKGRKKRIEPKDDSDNSDDEEFKPPLARPSRSRARKNPVNDGSSATLGTDKAPTVTGSCNVDGDSSDDENLKRALELSKRESRPLEEEDEDLKKALELSMIEARNVPKVENDLPLVKLHGKIIKKDDDDDFQEALRRSLFETTNDASTSVLEISDTSASGLEVSITSASILVIDESSESHNPPMPSTSTSVIPIKDTPKEKVPRSTEQPNVNSESSEDIAKTNSSRQGCLAASFNPSTSSSMKLRDRMPSNDLDRHSDKNVGDNVDLTSTGSGQSVVISDDEFDAMCNTGSILQRLSDHCASTPYQKGEPSKPKSDAFLESSFDNLLRDVNSKLGKGAVPINNQLVDSDKLDVKSTIDNTNTQNCIDSVPGSSGTNKFRNTRKDEKENTKGEKSKNNKRGKGLSKENGRDNSEVYHDDSSRTPSPGGSPDAALNPQQATQRMRNVFQSGLDIHLRGEEMQACRAIETELYPHQRVALAWMFAHEQKENDGLRGGILADDMGLGKTLTVIALIMTNHHDGRPMAKPELGYTRPAPVVASGGRGRGKGRRIEQGSSATRNVDKLGIGKKISKSSVTSPDSKKPVNRIFGRFNDDSLDSEVENHNPAFRFSSALTTGSGKKYSIGKGARKNVFESSSSEDEFDMMSKSQSSLSSKWSVTSLEETFKGAKDPREKILDDLDDDDEFNAMSHEEKLEAMKPTAFLDGSCDVEFDPLLNVDGGMSFHSDSDEEPVGERRKKRARIVDSDSEEESGDSKKNKVGRDLILDKGDSDNSLPEIRTETPESEYSLDGDESEYLPGESGESRPSTPQNKQVKAQNKVKNVARLPLVQPPSQNGVSECASVQPKLLIPPKQPADRNGRRRPTLIVCPTSLIDHWHQQIHHHLNKSVDIRVKVHHGTSKALTGADLDTQDVVITTYGTLAAEFRSQDMSPLLRAKWLRVVLDEGHYIKNNRSLMAKGAHNLDTQRRWVVTGTPIQNNLMELWSLVNWLDFGLYAFNQNAFKRQIEKPCRNREPIGFERLQLLLDTICLRRTKSDKRPDGSPLVDLPKKTVVTRQVKFTTEEKLFYTAFHKKSAEIVQKYHRRGDLMRNYAHIFALMTRLRQLCCHPELVPVDWGMARKDKKALEAMMEQETLAQDMTAAHTDGKEGNTEQESLLAKQLRQMIKSGVTDDCSICLDDFTTPVITPCAHVFCRMCIEQVLHTIKPPNCPLCRRPLKKAQLLEAESDEDVDTDDDDETLKAMEDIIVEVSSSKVNAVLREMLRLRRDCPGDKIIIVSQFTSFLSIIQPLLRENEFSYTRLDGSMNHRDRAIVVNDFQNVDDPSSPQVLLLSLRAGGVGLNLTAANHLMLLDPAWNPATEWQCFDRCHRLGQTKDVNIYKFLTNDSIEGKMVDIQDKKTELISGAFQNTPEEARRQRINDIRNIFGI